MTHLGLVTVAQRVARAIGARSVLDCGIGGATGLFKVAPDLSGLPGYRACDLTVATECQPADLVVCIDALDRIAPGRLDAALDRVAGLSRSHLLVAIPTVSPDGARQHPERWLPMFGPRMAMIGYTLCDDRFWILARQREAWSPSVDLDAVVRGVDR